MDAQIGNYAGIVALASFAIKETFAFVRPLLLRKNNNGTYDIKWDKVAEMMTVQSQKIDRLDDGIRRQTDTLERLVEQLSKQNDYLLKQAVREEMRRDRPS